MDLLSDMLAHGASVNRRDSLGDTALWWATNNAFWEAVPLLLAYRANINARGKVGITALMDAVSAIVLATPRQAVQNDAASRSRNNTEELATIRLLLSYHTDVDLVDKWGETVLAIAIKQPQTSLVQQIVELLKQGSAK